MIKVKLVDTGKFSKQEVSLLNNKFVAIINDAAGKNDVGEGDIQLICESVIIKKIKKRKKSVTNADKIKAIGFEESVEKYLLDKDKKGLIKNYNVKDIIVAAENSILLELSVDHQKQLLDQIIENRLLINDRNYKDIALIAAQENQLNTGVLEHLIPLIVASAETLHAGLQQYENIEPDVSLGQDQHLKDILGKVSDDIKVFVK